MDTQALLDRILEGLKPYEFRTLVLGFARPEAYDREQHEALYREVKIELGDEIVRRLGGVEIDFNRPDLRVEIDSELAIRYRPAPLFLGGRYRKLSREIPASRWIHHRCHGRGCPSCSHTGSLSRTSIEELLVPPVLESSGGSRAFFHALGREDTDARMLGSGRPFVLEVQDPRRRSLPLEAIVRRFAEEARHMAEIVRLVPTTRDTVAIVKEAGAPKTYRVWLHVGGELPPDAGKRVADLTGCRIEQLSPKRVMHRRGRDTCRERRILESSWPGEVEGHPLWELKVESGTYVKELVSGDGGRTRPSLSAVLGVPCRCEALDVLEIHWRAPWET